MSELRIYPEHGNGSPQVLTDPGEIAKRLDAVGVLFERWAVRHELDGDASQDEIIEAYREDIDNVIVHLREAFEELKADPNIAPNILEDMTIPGVTALDENSVKIRIMIKTVAGMQWAVGRAYNRLVKIHFDRAGIEIDRKSVV